MQHEEIGILVCQRTFLTLEKLPTICKPKLRSVPSIYCLSAHHLATLGGLPVLPHCGGRAYIVCCESMAREACKHSARSSRHTHVHTPCVTHM